MAEHLKRNTEKIEQELKQTQLLLKSCLESPKDIIIMAIDRDYQYLYFNEAHRTVMKYAYNADIEVGMNVLECISSEEDRKNAKTNYDRALSGESLTTIQEYGSVQRSFYESFYNPIRNEKSEVVGITAFARDITMRKQMEDRLRETNEYLENLFNYANAPIIVWNPQFKITRFNHAFERLTGRSAQEVIGHHLELLFPSELAQRSMVLIEKTLTGQRWETVEIAIQNRNGQIRTLLWNSATLFTPDRKTPVATIAQGQDITVRKMAEEELKQAYLKLDAFWNVATVENADVKTICDHVLESIVKMTASRIGFFGFIDEDQSGMTIHSWSGEAMKGCAMVNKPTYFPIAEAGVWGEAIRKGTFLILNDYSQHHPAKKGLPQGHVPLTNLLVVPVVSRGKIVAVAAVANREANYTESDAKHLTAFGEAIQAIIDRKRAEEELVQSNARLEQALTAANAGPWDWNIVDNTFYWSKEFITIFGMETTVRPGFEAWTAVVHQADRETASKRIQDSINTRTDLVNDYRIIHPDGSIRWIRAIGKTQFEGEKPVRMNGLCIDITERKRAEDEREKLEHKLNQAQKLESL
ncbi:MAG: PAS domain S-box protein, partial [Chitinivibrionales bacterium]|nr:PAS domain S-box protein [Chitinivibrionales bacterium]